MPPGWLGLGIAGVVILEADKGAKLLVATPFATFVASCYVRKARSYVRSVRPLLARGGCLLYQALKGCLVEMRCRACTLKNLEAAPEHSDWAGTRSKEPPPLNSLRAFEAMPRYHFVFMTKQDALEGSLVESDVGRPNVSWTVFDSTWSSASRKEERRRKHMNLPEAVRFTGGRPVLGSEV